MTENEIKVLDINVDEIKASLKLLGFQQQEEKYFKRVIFNTIPYDEHKWVRLRTDGGKTTLTYKNFKTDAIDGVEEVEVGVSCFDSCRDLLCKAGLKPVSYQENKRTEFTSSDKEVEISIDTWPNIPPYLEIEAKTSQKVKDTLTELSLDNLKKTSVTTQEVYKLYDIDISGMRDIRF